MNREIIDKCLDFAEGKKGTFTILTVKKPDFPENLISGTEKQQTINGYVKEGYSTTKMIKILGQKLTADKKAELFQAIKEKCYDLLTVSND